LKVCIILGEHYRLFNLNNFEIFEGFKDQLTFTGKRVFKAKVTLKVHSLFEDSLGMI